MGPQTHSRLASTFLLSVRARTRDLWKRSRGQPIITRNGQYLGDLRSPNTARIWWFGQGPQEVKRLEMARFGEFLKILKIFDFDGFCEFLKFCQFPGFLHNSGFSRKFVDLWDLWRFHEFVKYQWIVEINSHCCDFRNTILWLRVTLIFNNYI